MNKNRNRIRCRAGAKPDSTRCHAKCVSTKSAITDDAFNKLVDFIAGELDHLRQAQDGDDRKRDHRSGVVDLKVGFYLGRDGVESLVPLVQCFSDSFREEESLAKLRESLEAAWQKAQEILHPEKVGG